jgi:hypothetical protein
MKRLKSLCFVVGIFKPKPRNSNRRETKRTKSPWVSAAFVSFVAFCKMDWSLSLVAAPPLQVIRGSWIEEDRCITDEGEFRALVTQLTFDPSAEVNLIEPT